MMQANEFLAAAGAQYTQANTSGLNWLLARPSAQGFLNTKLNSITLADYTSDDGLRGPEYTYGWIQGRGLEALATFAEYLVSANSDLAQRIDVTGKKLYARLARLQAENGHAYFCYDQNFLPVYRDSENGLAFQKHPDDIYTYADAFVAKGLVAGAARYAPNALPQHLAYLGRVIASIEAGRFQMDEKCQLSEKALETQADDFGPRMILLGGAALLKRLGYGEHTKFADRFISHVLTNHLDKKKSLLLNVAGADEVNVGHGTEFVGFALDHLMHRQGSQSDISSSVVETLEKILIASFQAGFVGPGIALSISASSGKTLSPYCPWWSLPETIRAAALVYKCTGNAGVLQIWEQAHEAFFNHYWRQEPPIAYQTLNQQGPTDFVPATSDLDPLYHTGLSLLAAVRTLETDGNS